MNKEKSVTLIEVKNELVKPNLKGTKGNVKGYKKLFFYKSFDALLEFYWRTSPTAEVSL